MRVITLISMMAVLLLSTPGSSLIRSDTELSTSFDERGPLVAYLNISIEGMPFADGEGGISLGGVSLDYEGSIKVGLSGGAPFEMVNDPAPGSPLIPWIATTISTGNEILSVSMRSGRGVRFTLPAGILTVPPPSSHRGPYRAFGVWDGERDYPRNRVLLQPLGFRHTENGMEKVYSLWYSPVYLSGPSSGELNPDTTLEMELSEEEAEPTPTRALGDPAMVPGTTSIYSGMDIPPEYLIITAPENVDVLRDLAGWRNRRGLATSVISIDDILGNYSGSDDPADLLREYIRDVLTGWGRLRYVLLAGDWETVPVKLVKDSDPSSWDDGWIPADTYFQCLDGTWDLDGDGIYGEVGDLEDIIPDVIVSRLAIDDPSVWSRKVEQLIAYDKGADLGTWSSGSVLIGANTHAEGDGTQFSEYLRGKYLDETYDVFDTQYEDQGTLSHSTIDAALEEGASFVQFVDHGGPQEWCDDYGAGVVYRARDANSLGNGNRLPFVSTLACLTTWFDDSSGCPYKNWDNCLGEAFTENTDGGALGYVGSSRTSVGIINTNRYLPYDNGLVEDTARQVGTLGKNILGEIHTGGKTHYAEVWGAQFAKENNPEISLCWLEFTLLGEPAGQMWTENLGQIRCQVDHEDDLDPHIVVHVTDDSGAPIQGANVTLQNFNRGIFHRSPTDEDGKAVFDLVLDWYCDINLTVTSRDHKPFLGFIRISDVVPPVTDVLMDPGEPNGENGWYLAPPTIRLVPNEKGKVHLRIGSGGDVILNSSINFTVPTLPEGITQLHFFSEDEAGNLEIERHLTVMIDSGDPRLIPDIEPDAPDGENGWYTSEPLITLSTPEDDQGSPVRFMYVMDGIEKEYAPPLFIPEGIHEIDIWAEDLSGRTSNISTLVLKVDTTPPDTSFEIDPDEPNGKNGWYDTSPLVTLTAAEEGCRIEYRFSSTSAFRLYEGALTIPDGKRYLEYRSIDPAGNLGPTKKVLLMVDTSAPTISYRISPLRPDGENGYYRKLPELSFQWSDEEEALIFVSMDGEPWEEWRQSRLIGDGEHRIEAYAEDLAGHRSGTISLELLVDSSVPETGFDIKGAMNGDWYVSRPIISLDGGSGSVTYYRWDEGEEYIEYGYPISPPVTEGISRLHFHSVDIAGNVEDEKILIIRIDTEAPRPSLSYTLTDEGRLTLDMSGSTDGTDLEYRFLIDGELARDWSGDPYFTMKLDPGIHHVNTYVRDSGGNTASLSRDVEVKDAAVFWLILSSLLVVVLLAGGLSALLLSRRRRERLADLQYGAVRAGAENTGYGYVKVVEAEEL